MAAGWILATTRYEELRYFVLFCSPKLHLYETQVRKVKPLLFSFLSNRAN